MESTSRPDDTSLYDQAGGEPGLRRCIERFVDKVFDDVMIGYLFRAADRQRVKHKEFEHAAEALGAAIEYTGRPLAAAHAPHRIRGGQFMRRIQILKDALAECGMPAAVVEALVQNNLSLQPLITADEDGVCDPAFRPPPKAPER
jgi:hemoglobin